MGRTNPTFRDVVRALESRWEPYRRVLRKRDREHFDALFQYGREYADAASHLNHESPVVPVLVAVCLAQERRIAGLESRLDAARADREPEGDERGDGEPESDERGDGERDVGDERALDAGGGSTGGTDDERHLRED